MSIFRVDQPIVTPATGPALPFKTFIASVLGHAVVIIGILQMGMTEFSPPETEAIIVDLIFEKSGASSNNETRSEPKAVATPAVKKAILTPAPKEISQAKDFEQTTVQTVAVFSELTEPAPPEKQSATAARAIVAEMPAEDIEASTPVILTATMSIIEPAPIVPRPEIKTVLPRPKTHVDPVSNNVKKRRETKPGKKKKQIARRASLPGKGQKQKGRTQNIQTQGVRYTGAGLSNPRPRYPPAARRKRVQGRVLLAVVVTKSGRASSVRIRKSSGFQLLDQAALKTVKRWRFRPATRNGRPVRARVIVPVTFKLKG